MYTAVLKLPFAFRVDQKLRVSATALVLTAVMLLSACWFKPQWIQTAEQDLPVLVQMAESIATIIALTQTPQAPSQQTVYAIQHIGDVATQGLKAIQALYNSYKSGNATTTIQEIEAAGQALTANLQQLLAAAQIKDDALLKRVAAAVDLIVSTVNTILSLIPTPAVSAKARKVVVKSALPTAKDLRSDWAARVGTPLVK